MNMKPLQTFLAALLLTSVAAQGGLYTRYSGSNPLVGNDINIGITDGNPTGISDVIHVSGVASVIESVSVLINVTGGFNGDLYAYLSYNGVLVPLLNRVGTGTGDAVQMLFGYATAGFNNVRLSDAGSLNIHGVATPSSSPTTYLPDGASSLSSITGNPNGDWTIFFSDMAGGGGTPPSTLVSWSLDITAVPEPANVALGIFGGVFALIVTFRSARVRALLRGWQVAASRWVDAV